MKMVVNHRYWGSSIFICLTTIIVHHASASLPTPDHQLCYFSTCTLTDTYGAMDTTLKDGTTCEIGKGLVFDGINDWANLGDVPLGGAMTISSWSQYDSFATAFSRVYDFNNGGNANTQIHLAHGQWPNGQLPDMEIRTTTGSSYSSGTVYDIHMSGGNAWVQGAMTNIIRVWDGNGRHYVYINGVLKHSAGPDNRLNPPLVTRGNHWLSRAASSSSSAGRMKGVIKALTIWKRALSASEVSQAYSSTDGCPTSQIVRPAVPVEFGLVNECRQHPTRPSSLGSCPST
mmetsp:Transcript_20505/g.33296  ORF Transcript_20505/g.33296 Transcript_20505/m.33296 type:complete len:287 (+) Transcript_20505:3-863(+)